MKTSYFFAAFFLVVFFAAFFFVAIFLTPIPGTLMSTARDTGLKIWWHHQTSPQYRGCYGAVKGNSDESATPYGVWLGRFGSGRFAFLNITRRPFLSIAFR